MDNQTPNALEQPTSIPKGTSQTATTPTQPAKPYGRNWKEWILIYLIIGAIIYAGVYYFVLSKQSSKPQSAPVIKTLTTPTPPLNNNIKTYTDQKLGITFNYLTKDPSIVVFPITENKVCITYDKTDNDCNNGQYVEVFTKTADQTLKEAIEKQILKGIDQKDCYVINITKEYSKNALPNLEYDMITFPKTNDNNDPFSQSTAIKCPEKYREKNGVSYFMADKNFPTKFAFFNIGQYAIMAGKNTVWQATFKFTESKQTMDTSSWKTYSDPKYKISFKYPAVDVVAENTHGDSPYIFGLKYWLINNQNDNTYAGWRFEAWDTLEEIEKQFGIKNTDWVSIKVNNTAAKYFKRSTNDELVVFEGSPLILAWFSPVGISPDIKREFELSYKSFQRTN